MKDKIEITLAPKHVLELEVEHAHYRLNKTKQYLGKVAALFISSSAILYALGYKYITLLVVANIAGVGALLSQYITVSKQTLAYTNSIHKELNDRDWMKAFIKPRWKQKFC